MVGWSWSWNPLPRIFGPGHRMSGTRSLINLILSPYSRKLLQCSTLSCGAFLAPFASVIT